MDKQTVEVQKTLLPLAIKIHEICLCHRIEYSLEGGSLLGAVRHHGFIPWDNDFDFFMSRENYDKFIAIAENELGTDYEVFTYQTNSNYPFAFAKIMIKNKPITYYDQFFSFPTKLHIDIFPFDGVAPNRLGRIIQKYKALYYKKMLIIHDGGKPPTTDPWYIKKAYTIAKLISKLYSHNGLVKKSEKNLRKYPNSDMVSIMMGYYGYNKTMMKKYNLTNYTSVDFERHQFMCITNYDQYLSQLYGDYMTLPPKEKRNGHNFVLI